MSTGSEFGKRNPNPSGVPLHFNLSVFFEAIEQQYNVFTCYYDLVYLLKNNPDFEVKHEHVHHYNSFCHPLCNTPEGVTFCNNDEIQKVKTMKQLAKPLVMTCGMGVKELLIPVFGMGELLGVVMIEGLWPRKAVDEKIVLKQTHSNNSILIDDISAFPEQLTILNKLIALFTPFQTLIELRYLLQVDDEKRKENAATTNVQKLVQQSRLASLPIQIDLHKKLSSPIQRAVGWMASNYYIDITIEQVAAFVGLSEHYFCKRFKEETGVSFHQLLLDYRLEAAMYLIKRTDMNLTQVAIEIGFSYSSTFYRAFRKKFLMSPKEVRMRPTSL